MPHALPCNQRLHCADFLSAIEAAVANARDDLGDVPTGAPDGPDHVACDMRQTCGPVAWRVLHAWADAVHDQICPHCGQFAKDGATFLHDLVNLKLGKAPHDPETFSRMCATVAQLQASQGAPTGSVLADIEEAMARADLGQPLPRRLRRAAMRQGRPDPRRDPWGSRCRDPVTGQWIMGGECPAVPSDPFTPDGNELTWAIGPQRLQRYEFVYRVVEADELIASHNPSTFAPNPAFPPELQPRIRERAAPRVQVERIASNLDTRLLLEEFRSLDRGAPIVGSDRVVESGNGRVMAIQRAVLDFPDSYGRYRDRLLEVAPAFGQDVEAVRGMTAPVLVRERLTEVDRTEFVEEANASSSISRSTVEIARSDADNITVDMLDALDVLENESIEDALRAARNRSVVQRFLATVPSEEQAALVDASGVINQDGIRRLGTALFVRTFGVAGAGFRMAERWFETTEPDVRNVFNGVSRALGPLARAEGLTVANERDPGLSIAQDLAEVITVYSQIKRSNTTVEKYLQQAALFERQLNPFQESMLVAIDARRRSAKRIGAVLRSYAEQVIASPPPAQGALLPGAEASKEGLWEEAVKRSEQETAPQGELLASAPRRVRMGQGFLGQFTSSVASGAGFGVGAALAGVGLTRLLGVDRQGQRVGQAAAHDEGERPPCTQLEAERLERCIQDVKARNREDGCPEGGTFPEPCEATGDPAPNPWSTCTNSLGCRPE